MQPRVMTPILCCHDIDLPVRPRWTLSYPFYVVKRRDEPRTGIWVVLCVDMEIVVCIFVSSFSDITDFAHGLCTVCDFPVDVCHCGTRALSPARKWNVRCEHSGLVESQADLARALSSKKCKLHLELDFDEIIIQSKKTYVEILAEPERFEPIIKISEDCVTLIYQLQRSRNVVDAGVCLGVFIRSVTGRSNVFFMKDLIEKFVSEMSEFFEPQSGGHWTSTLSDIYENYAKCKESKLATRLKSVFNHLIMHCLYFKMGIEVDSRLFDQLEKQKIRPTLIDCATFADAVAGLVTFLLKHGRQCMIAGSLEPMFMDGDSVTDWLTKTKKLKADFEFLGNPAAVGIDLHDYLNDLDSAIDVGKSLSKFMSHNCPEQRVIIGMVTEMDAMRNRYLSVTAASALRKQPLGVVIYGTPGIGKSSILDILFDYDAKIRGRNPSRAFRFQFSAKEEYMTNFKSYMHTIVLDDVAQHVPNKVQGVDKTVEYIISIVNNQGHCPPQASLEDKGKTPILVDLCLITTNKRDMNIPLYYQASYAVYRRVPIHIEPIVKEQYRKEGSSDIDPNKAKDGGAYPDYWIWKVSLAKATSVGSQMGDYAPYKDFDNINEFLEWFKMRSDEHHAQQTRFMAESRKYEGATLCSCGLPSKLCDCDSVVSQGIKTMLDGTRYYTPDRVEEREEIATVTGLFLEEEPDWSRPWRKTLTKGEPRLVSFSVSAKFLQKHDTEGKAEAKFWAYEELPMLLGLGCSDDFIINDFHECLIYKRELRQVDELEGMIEVFMGIIKEDVGIPDDSWSDRFVRWCITCWFSHATVRKTVKYFGRYECVRRFFLQRLRPYLVKTETQKHIARHLGETIDKVLGADNVWIRVGVKLVQAITGAGILFGLWTYIKSTRVHVPVSEYRPDDTGAFWNYVDGVKKEPWTVVTDEGKTEQVRTNDTTVIAHHNKVEYRPDENGAYWAYNDGEKKGPWLVDNNGGKIQVTTSDNTVIKHHVDLREREKLLSEFNNTVFEEDCEIEAQALRDIGGLPKRAPGDGKSNPWAQSERTVTTVDFLPKRVMHLDAFNKKVIRNTLRFKARGSDSGGTFIAEGILIVLSNDCFVTNNHSMPHDDSVQLTISFDGDGHVRPDVCTLLRQSQIMRIPLRDICIVTTKSLPAFFVDISNNFVRDSFDGKYDGFYLIRKHDGSVEQRPVYNVFKTHYTRLVGDTEFDFECFTGIVETPTESGHCGAPLILETGFGPVVVGFHSLFAIGSNRVYASKFTHEDFSALATKMEVQVGKIPVDESTLSERAISYVDFHDDGKLMYHGELKAFRTRPKHNVCHSELFENIVGKEVFGHTITEKLTYPVMDNWRPQQLGLSEFIKPVDFMDETTLQRCSKSFLKHVLSHLPVEELDLLGVVNVDVAVNGMPGMAYMDRIKMSTSMGNPYNTTKRKFLIPLSNDLWTDGMRFIPEVETVIEEMIEKLKRGVRCHAIFTAHLKDEAVSFKKAKSGKTRIFFSGPGTLLVIVRMYFMSFCRVVQRNRGVFLCAVGLNTTSLEWDKLYHYLARFGVDTAIAGDYEFYDKKIKILLVRVATEFIIDICVASGNFSGEELLVMRTLMMDLASPTVDFFGMLMTLLGGEVSGHQFTTVLNCIVNVFYLMYAWEKAGYDVDEFFDFVVAIVLGDDHVVCVSPERPLYTHTLIQEVMCEIGVGYTMADKSSESVPYIPLSEAVFLKRGFKYDANLGVVVGPLDVDSIFKMLMMQVRSKTCTIHEQLAQAITSASSEAFFHGRQFFEELNALIDACPKSAALRAHMGSYPRLSFNQNLMRFWETDVRQRAYDVGPRNQKQHLLTSYCTDPPPVLQGLVRMESRVLSARAFPKDRIYDSVKLSTKENLKVWSHESVPTLENHRLSQTNEQTNNNSFDVPMTEGSVLTTVQQTTFANETAPVTLDLGTSHDAVADSQLVPAHLGEFFGRPTRIFSYTWTENGSAGLKASFFPWRLFFQTASIRNKLQNFGLIRCKLKLKFTINASQFYYGAIGAFYHPLQGFLKDTTGGSLNYVPGSQVLISQRPHVWLDPQSTSTAEMTLPFLYHQNWLRADTTDMERMGEIDLFQYAALRSANGVSTTGVTIVVYAWAEDVEVTAPTVLPVMQSKKEYVKDGQVSAMASTVSGVASRLANIPIVGRYAKATEMVASGIGSVASFFGFTNVPVIRDVEPMKNLPFHTLSSSTISEPITKLSLQPKQEVSVDTTVLGDAYGDQMHIANFCARESFLCGVLWTTTAAENAILFTSSVTPELYERSPGTNFGVFSTPMNHASKLFEFWRGDIIFRFKIIKTQYHRGRVNLCWDARCATATAMPSYGEPGVMNILFDLEDSDELEVRVPWMQAVTFLRMDQGTRAAPIPSPPWSNGPTPNFSWGSGNGFIQMRVVNRLTAPEASSDVDVLVFVRAADNIEFAGPNDIPARLSLLELQSKKTYDVHTFGNPSVSHPDTYNEVFGERIASFRELLHRTSKTATVTAAQGEGFNGIQQVASFPFKRLPRAYGYSTNGVDTAVGTITPASNFSFNFVRNHPITWLANCFVGYKGSVNYVINTNQYNGKYSVAVSSISVVRCGKFLPISNKPYSVALPTTGTGSALAKLFNTDDKVEESGGAGMALTNQYTQAGVSVNLPYYAASKFMFNNLDSYYGTTPVGDDSHEDWFVATTKRGIVNNVVDQDLTLDFLCGSGPDFNLIFFLNCPAVFFLPSPPAV